MPSEHFAVGLGAVQTRLKYGWTNEQAFGLESPPKRGRNKGRSITIDGKAYKSLSDAAEAFGIPPNVLGSRLRSGWTPEEAVGLERRRKRSANSKVIAIGGNKYASIRKACEELGHPYGRIASRLQLGWTVEQAFELAPPPPPSGEKNGKAIDVRGVKYSSNAKAAKAFGIDPRVFNKRLKQGWTVEEALNIASRVGLHKED